MHLHGYEAVFGVHLDFKVVLNELCVLETYSLKGVFEFGGRNASTGLVVVVTLPIVLFVGGNTAIATVSILVIGIEEGCATYPAFYFGEFVRLDSRPPSQKVSTARLGNVWTRHSMGVLVVTWCNTTKLDIYIL